MFDGVIGKFILFWIFMLGVAFFGRFLGFAEDKKTMIIFLIACALVYVVWMVARSMAKKRRENR